MAKLYFRYGAMGSSKTANALMVAYNYKERGKRALLAKPKLDTREIGVMHSRIGLEEPCIYVEDLVEMSTEDLEAYDCIIVDEAQFCKKSDIEFFTHLVDLLLKVRSPGADVREFRPQDDFIQLERERCLYKEPRLILGILRFGMKDIFLGLINDPQFLLVAVAAVFEEVEDLT